MKLLRVQVLIIVLVVLGIAACSAQTPVSAPSASPAPTVQSPYRDGTYEYTGKNDAEGYYVKGTLKVAGGKIASAEWAIYDANRNSKLFDKDYETVFAGNDTYIQQCRDNLKGMAGYTASLVESQDVDQVDAVTGATWAYHKFNEFVKGALEKAE